jgi:GMP synthase-like glutamine amidotransferase
MRPVLIVTHLADRQVGLVGDALQASGCDVIERHAAADDPLPAAGELAGIVSLGGRQSATRAVEDPFLAAEVALLRAALDDDVPVLGMCLGAQLLAVAAGGEVVNTGRISAGWPDLVLLPAATADPLFGGLPPRLPVLKWHEDVIELPEQPAPLGNAEAPDAARVLGIPEGPGAARVLGISEGPGAALFRIGSRAWGSQAHLELTPELLVDVWLADPAEAADVIAAGHDLDAFRTRSRQLLIGQMAAARPMFEAFGRIAASRG